MFVQETWVNLSSNRSTRMMHLKRPIALISGAFFPDYRERVKIKDKKKLINSHGRSNKVFLHKGGGSP
jgi:hypothetical protein